MSILEVFTPADVLPECDGMAVAVDTETSKLHPDDGGYVAVVSVAWIPDHIVHSRRLLNEAIRTGDGVISYAFPFDQGLRDKPDIPQWAVKKYKPDQLALGVFDEDVDINLPLLQWWHVLRWLKRQRLEFHNAKFDLMHLRHGLRYAKGTDLEEYYEWDTALISKDLWPLEIAALKPTMARLFGDDELAQYRALKKWLGPEKDRRFDLVPWHIIGPYAAKDAEQTIRLFWHQQIVRQKHEFARPVFMRRKLDVSRVLYRVEERGIPYDAVASLDAVAIIEEARDKLLPLLPFANNINAVKRYYFDPVDKGGLGYPPYKATKVRGEPTIDEDTIRLMVRDGLPYIETYAEVDRLERAIAVWYSGYANKVGADGCLRMVFKQILERTGRFSAERVNLLAIPHDHRLSFLPDGVPMVRDLFTVPPGFIRYEIDLSQAELRIAAIFANCRGMIDKFTAGIDLHDVTCTQLFDMTSNHPQWTKYRGVAKSSNFALIFDVKPLGLKDYIRKSTGIDLTLGEATDIHGPWHELYPEIKVANDRTRYFLERNGYVVLVNGERSYFPTYEPTHKAFNRRVQTSLSILAQEWMIDTERRYPGILLLTIHDSQVVDIPIDGVNGLSPDQVALDIAARVARMGTEMFGVPMKADVKLWNQH